MATILSSDGNSMIDRSLGVCASRNDCDPNLVKHGLIEATQAYCACLISGAAPDVDLQSAWDEFYHTYAPVVAQVARERVRAAFDPDDAIQEIWQTIVTRICMYRPEPTRDAFHKWLVVVARHRLSDCRRRDARVVCFEACGTPLGQLQAKELDPVASCEQNDLKGVVAGLLADLQRQVSPLSYRVFHLRSIEELDVSHVASILGLTPNQVRARHHRMIEKLRNIAGEPL